jgi:hypothetical protein
VTNAAKLADDTQVSFQFDLSERAYPLNRERFRLPNGGFDLDKAVADLLRNGKCEAPIVFITSLPYGDREMRTRKDHFYFSGYNVAESDVSVISTYIWERLPGDRRLQPYLLRSLAIDALFRRIDVGFHSETRGCILDYCYEPTDIDKAQGDFCPDCRVKLQARVQEHEISLEQVASILRLTYRAAGRKFCFVIMPFDKKLDPVFEVVRSTLVRLGWVVTRADDVIHPRRIPDAIWESILRSDLLIADLTYGNENVFYELGFAHAMRCDAILTTQERRLPFDTAWDRAIFYTATNVGLKRLQRELSRLAGPVVSEWGRLDGRNVTS